MSVYFNAYRDNAYDRGGEEIIKYDGVTVNVGRALDPDTGIFTCTQGGTHLFTSELSTSWGYDGEKRLLTPLLRILPLPSRGLK